MFETDRLTVRKIGLDDADFMLALLNDPGFIANIGDRRVRTIEEAAAYIEARILASFAAHGFGFYRVALRASDDPVGIVSIVRRDGLDGPDLGFAMLERHVRRGYAREAAAALMAYARKDLGLPSLLAFTGLGNEPSARLLIALGFREIGLKLIPSYDEPSRLFTNAAG